MKPKLKRLTKKEMAGHHKASEEVGLGFRCFLCGKPIPIKDWRGLGWQVCEECDITNKERE